MSSKAENLAKLVTVLFPVCVLTVLVAVTWSFRTASSKPTRAVLVPITCAVLIRSLLNVLPLIIESALNEHIPIPSKYLQPQYDEHGGDQHEFKAADLHADTLLWNGRDFKKQVMNPMNKLRHVGHVDLPRLRKGNVALQVFAIVNSVPHDINFESNAVPPLWKDSITLKAILERWAINSWFSPKHRVFHSARRLHVAAAIPTSNLKVVQFNSDLPLHHQVVDAHDDNKTVHAIIAIEGLSCLERDIANVDAFFNAGVRVMGPTHFFDTEVGGSLSGECQCGLSEFGRSTMKRMKELGMIVDFAHAHPKLVTDILSLPTDLRPAMILSHTGVKSICNSSRNVDDHILQEIADAGGIIGVTLFAPAICGPDLVKSFVASVKHIIRITRSVQVVAVGSDWDGSVSAAVTPDRLHVLASALMNDQEDMDMVLSRDDVERIMFRNANDFFKRSLPSVVNN